MFLRRGMHSIQYRYCLYFGRSALPMLTLNGRKYYYKKVFKHFFSCRVTFLVRPTGLLFRRVSSGLKDDSDPDDSAKDICDSAEFYEDYLGDVSEARQLLYPSSNHPLVKLLNSSASVQDVFDVVRNHEADIDACSVSQAVLVLWDLQKAFYDVNVMNCGGFAEHSRAHSKDILTSYLNQIRAHPSYEHLLDLVYHHVELFSVEALTCTFLHLSKMSVEMHHDVMHALMLRCLTLLRDSAEVSLTALAWFIAAVQDVGLWSLFVLKDVLPAVFHKMEACENPADFELLTTCLIGSHRLLDLRRLEAYKHLVERLLTGGQLTECHSSALLKAAYFLNYPPWSHCNSVTVRRLLLLLTGSVCSLPALDLVRLHRVFMSHLEPAELLEEMTARAAHLLASSCQSDVAHLPSQCELLECVVVFSLPSQKHAFEKLVVKHLEDDSFVESVAPLFKVLCYLKTPDVHLYDRFWSQTLRFLEEHEEERLDYKLLKMCYRYMHFNSHLGGTYRHLQFELHVLQWLWEHLSSGVVGLVPSKFSQVASFVLAYAGSQQGGHERLLGLVMSKISDMLPQFSEIDCLNVSRGLQVGMRLQRRGWQAMPQLLWDLASVNSALDDWSLAQLQHHLPMHCVNLIMKAYMCRRGASNTDLFLRLVSSIDILDDKLNSRLIRGLTVNLLLSRCLLRQTIDRMAEYTVANNIYILGETVGKLLNLCYKVAYCPASEDQFLSSATQVVLRDKERMSGIMLLQSALALCFFQHLPQQLIYLIFTVDFMERLDQEVSQCYSKATYPTRVRHHLMQLNRAVCLDCPEASVPWFHEKYVQQLAAQEPFPTSPFFLDVQKAMTAVVGGKEFVKSNVHSPYGYNIDFQVLLGEDKQPLLESEAIGRNVSRVAVLLHNEREYSVHEQRLGGPAQLKQRHLELLGYKVLGISESQWHSMYMSELQAKHRFLHNELFKGP